jgi:bifunctional ADP-heptose synthase (sugar kinase/adenylyltransferase)
VISVKIYTPRELAELLPKEKRERKLALAIGTFNPPRAHHYSLFMEAAKNADLAVALNDDNSLKGYRKNSGRNDFIYKVEFRSELIFNNSPAKYIVTFSEPDAVAAIRAILPNEYWKGSDYSIDTINQRERDAATGLGIDICFAKNSIKEPFDFEAIREKYEAWKSKHHLK